MSAAFLSSVRVPLPALAAPSTPLVTARRNGLGVSSTPLPCRWSMVSSPDPSKPPSAPVTGAATGDDADMYSIDTEAIVERAQQVFNDVTDRPVYYSKIAAYAVGAIVILTVTRAIVSAIDSLPVLPGALELIGLGYSAWFVWRYVLFRESRTELMDEIDDFLGRARGSK